MHVTQRDQAPKAWLNFGNSPRLLFWVNICNILFVQRISKPPDHLGAELGRFFEVPVYIMNTTFEHYGGRKLVLKTKKKCTPHATFIEQKSQTVGNVGVKRR